MDSKISSAADCDIEYIKAKVRYHRENVEFLKNATGNGFMIYVLLIFRFVFS